MLITIIIIIKSWYNAVELRDTKARQIVLILNSLRPIQSNRAMLVLKSLNYRVTICFKLSQCFLNLWTIFVSYVLLLNFLLSPASSLDCEARRRPDSTSHWCLLKATETIASMPLVIALVPPEIFQYKMYISLYRCPWQRKKCLGALALSRMKHQIYQRCVFSCCSMLENSKTKFTKDIIFFRKHLL